MSYLSLSDISEFTFKDKGSKFIAYVKRIKNKEEAENFVKELAAMHPKSRHVCYAYILDSEQEYRANDDGEPSGSAGMPIYGQLRSHKLRFTIAAVVRYFGGTLLGVPGLINAYKSSVIEAIKSANIIEFQDLKKISFLFKYELMESVMSYLKANEIDIIDRVYLTEQTKIIISVPKNLIKTTESQLQAIGCEIA